MEHVESEFNKNHRYSLVSINSGEVLPRETTHEILDKVDVAVDTAAMKNQFPSPTLILQSYGVRLILRKSIDGEELNGK